MKRKLLGVKALSVLLTITVMVLSMPILPATADAASVKTVDNWTALVSAVNDAHSGDVIQLDADIDATTSASLKVTENITVDGQGHTLDGQGKYGFFVTKRGGDLTLKNTVIENALRNKEKEASVIYAYSGSANLENCIISHCRDTYAKDKGVVYNSSYHLNMTNCTFLDNSNGLTIGSGDATIQNNILVGNQGDDLSFKSSSSKAKDGGHNLIGKASNTPSGFKSDTTRIDAGLSNYASWMADSGDLIAGEKHPAIDQIPTEGSFPKEDLYGVERPNGDGADIGAVEYVPDTGELTSIEITKAPNQTNYVAGERFNRAGMVVTGHYADGSTKVIRDYTFAPTDSLALGNNEITISYKNQTATQPITVSEADVVDSASKLKTAISRAKSGDTITLAGDITLDSSWGSAVSISGKKLTIDGQGFTVDGNNKGTFLESDNDLTLKNMVIQNMHAEDDYGAVTVTGGELVLLNCILKDNDTYYGSVDTHYKSAKLKMYHCTVMDNGGSNSKYGAINIYKPSNTTINDCIIVNNKDRENNFNDICSKDSGSITGDYNVVATQDKDVSWKSGDHNKIEKEYADYEMWMGADGSLYPRTLNGAANPALDIHPEEQEGVDMNGNLRPQGRGGDAGALEAAALNAAKPKLTKNLSPDEETYQIGDQAKPLDVSATISDKGQLSYEWYYVEKIDAVTSATEKIPDADTNTYTPETNHVGSRDYFTVVYNTNNDPLINGENQVLTVSEKHPVTVETGQLTLTGIQVTTPPDKVEYVEGQSFDPSGIEVSATYSDGKCYPLAGGYAIETNGPLTTSDTQIAISYEGQTTLLPIVVKAKATTGIQVKTRPTKTQYDVGENFEPAGMVIERCFNDGTSEDLNPDDFVISPGVALTANVGEVTIAYTDPVEKKMYTTIQDVQVGIKDIDQLREAIQKPPSDGTITLTNDITADKSFDPIEIKKSVTIDGAGYTINGNQQGALFTIGENAKDVTLKNLTITGMRSNKGGAVLHAKHDNKSQICLEKCVIHDNQGAFGAIYMNAKNSTLNVLKCSIFDNHAGVISEPKNSVSFFSAPQGKAGGIAIDAAKSVTLKENIVIGNTFFDDPFDISANKSVESDGGNMIGTQSGLMPKDNDSVDEKYGTFENYLDNDGVPTVSAIEGLSSVPGAFAVGEVKIKNPSIQQNILAQASLSDSLSFETTGVGEPTYQWYKDGMLIDNATESVYTPQEEGLYYAVATYTLPNASTRSVMSTICMVSNNVEPPKEAFTASFVGGEAAEGNAPSAIAASSGESFSLPVNTFAKEGYVFEAWNDGNKAYQPGASYTMPDHNVTFTATWQKQAEGGSGTGGGSTGGGNAGGGTGGAIQPPKDQKEYPITVDTAAHGHIEVQPQKATAGEIVAIKVNPENGYEAASIDVKDSHGNALDLTQNNGMYTFEMPKGGVHINVQFVKNAPIAQVFEDVAEDAYYYDAVQWAIENDITSGISDTEFAPNMECTRAQAVTFLWRAAGAPVSEQAENGFADVSNEDYYSQAVQWAVENGITSGTSATTFSPDMTCSRAQIVTFLWRYSGMPEGQGNQSFVDVSSDAYYDAAVQWAVENGITVGTAADTFSPALDCSRAQIVTFLYRDFAD